MVANPAKATRKERRQACELPMVTDLLKQDGQIAGAVGFDVRDGEFYVFKAKATVVTARGTGEALGRRA